MFQLTLIFIQSVFAYELSSIKVTGEEHAEVDFQMSSRRTALPKLSFKNNVVELSFMGASLSRIYQGKVDYPSPHILIRRINAYETKEGNVKVGLVLNGSLDSIKERVQLHNGPSGVKLEIKLPLSEDSTISWLQQEQTPLSLTQEPERKRASGELPFRFVMITLLIGLAGVASYFFVKFYKNKIGPRGKRKFLIEQLSYCPLGNKMGVAILKVGNEFVLVGITPNQISYLSSLKKLENNFLEDAKFERSAFGLAVKDEISKLKNPNLSV